MLERNASDKALKLLLSCSLYHGHVLRSLMDNPRAIHDILFFGELQELVDHRHHMQSSSVPQLCSSHLLPKRLKLCSLPSSGKVSSVVGAVDGPHSSR
jgi:hypothetical protein